MASILKVDAMQGVTSAGDITITSEGGAATQSLQQGLAKAWTHFNTNADNPPVSLDSFNVASLTDEDTEVSANLTSAMSNSNYVPLGSGGGPTLDNPSNRNLALQAVSTTKINSEMYSTSNSQSTGSCHIGALGDLA